MPKNKTPKRRDYVARDMLTNPAFRPQVIPNKKKYNRKRQKDNDKSI